MEFCLHLRIVSLFFPIFLSLRNLLFTGIPSPGPRLRSRIFLLFGLFGSEPGFASKCPGSLCLGLSLREFLYQMTARTHLLYAGRDLGCSFRREARVFFRGFSGGACLLDTLRACAGSAL